MFLDCHLDTADFEELPLDAVAPLHWVARLSCEKPLCADSMLDIEPLKHTYINLFILDSFISS